ncbi:MAG TPA: Do family serine endopeptidase, partial [Hyphomicrobiaceae bacterium]|nr:Do family serine endopeptidase [Hyphomicrobiaceae bacterium]
NRVAPASREAALLSFAPIVRKSAPAVVNVFVSARVEVRHPAMDDPIFRHFFSERFGMPRERVQNSLGSGVLVSPDGVLVTNYHVIKGAKSEVRIVTSDRREFEARLLLADEKTDIAILKIDNGATSFAFLELADSDGIEVGDLVLAIGNPFGVGQTVTHGIVSAIARTEVGQSEAQVFIQTDAAINPGNSGGALVDMSGRLVGINTSIYSRSGGSHGIGFAIPSNLARVYIESAMSGRRVERPWLGARLEPVTSELAKSLGLARIAGAHVKRVHQDSSAAAAGLQAGDVITAIDGTEVLDPRSLLYRLTTVGVGATVRLDYLRKGRSRSTELQLRGAPKPSKDDHRILAGPHPLDGATVATLTPARADELSLETEVGVVVTAVKPASIAAGHGFRVGDILVDIGRSAVASIADVETRLATAPALWQIAVKRGARVLTLRVPGTR